MVSEPARWAAALRWAFGLDFDGEQVPTAGWCRGRYTAAATLGTVELDLWDAGVTVRSSVSRDCL